MRIATYNVEWFTNLFDEKDRPQPDGGWSGRRDVTREQQLEALGIVFTAMDADAVMIIEAPDTNRHRSTVAALENFAQLYGLRTRAALTGFTNDTQQELALLYDPDALTARHDPQSGLEAQRGWVPRFDGEFPLDLDVDAAPETIRFSKPPLEVAARSAAGGEFRMIGVHLKSKAPHGARTRDEVIRISIANRRKQLAQAVWLRRRVEAHLAAGDPLIVLGDLNDGPGLDEYEKLFGRSGVEIVMGEADAAPLFDPHARQAATQKMGAQPATSRFFIAEENRYLSALLDYILISPDLREKAPRWRIWHPFDDPACYRTPELRQALLTASDHYPVTLDIDL
ncbi:endonuclease/exonuclease/phosphatase family protein [Pseudoruegeria sp. SHC-113]|uniref:endonuclease/exonuclease/phosphatase family protein n=1 Tax=Pseudoruegeria sp. SHC-113 TaxID=2855439 RepID=UPI0021BB446A|nr:endonuclease/exonuclease/phosphatase family protein [Pseudoruegeria sp. SHC-113]MCT8161498.1 endonuclease/exonuclease/phosphatase family protein [Pseudoruegeria sp. SHC-113]